MGKLMIVSKDGHVPSLLHPTGNIEVPDGTPSPTLSLHPCIGGPAQPSSKERSKSPGWPSKPALLCSTTNPARRASFQTLFGRVVRLGPITLAWTRQDVAAMAAHDRGAEQTPVASGEQQKTQETEGDTDQGGLHDMLIAGRCWREPAPTTCNDVRWLWYDGSAS